jgi:hypothetical protein
VLSRYFRGEISAPVTLMHLLIETEDADSVRATVAGAGREHERDSPGSATHRRARELSQLMRANASGVEKIAGMLRAEVDSSKPARTVATDAMKLTKIKPRNAKTELRSM